ncbi:S8A family peptidase [Corallococcus coralloides DSM 2259]|uniref:S8A family peptidase n=1 Tax=Corallococcus coralloides (strain ATCC 25202 / DSM 2259 / NBRC 100086 / M2) TaxID=1144275 RepID=H8MW43_CORCM|nr:S8 family peptidase [Corallococcus coralloides]AFE07003.1 S8A family peptidase [Corallococcus coralloides DSM 2259]
MLRRLALLGLLGLAACPGDNKDDDDDTTDTLKGTISGALQPFQAGSAAANDGSSLDAFFSLPGAKNLSQKVSKALAARGVWRTGIPSKPLTHEASLLPGEIIIRFDTPGLSAEEAVAQARVAGYHVVHQAFLSDTQHLLRYEVSQPQAMSGGAPTVRALTQAEHVRVLSQVLAVQGVKNAESNMRVRALAVPNDPLYSRQWHYKNMNLPAAWDLGTGSESIVVAVVDTGITSHPDLNTRVLPGVDLISSLANAGDGDGVDTDPTDNGKDLPNGGSSFHGTHVAGTIGASSNNGVGVAGVTWSGRNILPVRVLGTQGGSLADIIAGITWSSGGSVPGVRANTTPARVINMSLGGDGSASTEMQTAINAANARGSIIVVAAGNENVNTSSSFPCNQQNVICVGATRFNGKRASYSNFGTQVDVMAAGGQTSEDRNGDSYPDGVLSTLPNSSNQPSYEWYQGTSMATPHVAGIVALMLAQDPTLTTADVEAILKETADTTSQCSEGCGAGLVDAYAAVLRAKGGGDPSLPPKLAITTTQLSFTGASSQALTVRNNGGGTLQVSVAVSGTNASAVSVSSTSLSVPAYKSTALNVSVTPGSLAPGSYVAQIDLTGASGAGTAQVLVKFRVGATETKDAIIGFAYLDAAGEVQVDDDGIALVPASGGYNYSLKMTPRDYLVLASIDDTGEGDYFDDGDRVGFWRDTTQVETVTVTRGKTTSGISFTLVPYQSDDDHTPTTTIGGACTTNGACGTGGQCLTGASFPGGYCTQSCVTDSCPSGSECYSNDRGVTAYCFVTCTPSSGNTQGSCRTGYRCVSDGAGSGACLP